MKKADEIKRGGRRELLQAASAGMVAGLAIPLFCFMSVSEFIVANSVASALASFPQQAGTASSLVGALHYGSSVLSAALLGGFADGTPWPMGAIVGAAGVGCLVTVLLQTPHLDFEFNAPQETLA